MITEGRNPLTGMDFPDPDIIRVDDTYYMISTTMHFFPGAVILRSYDLINWEYCTYLYDALEHTDGERLEGERTVYGHGMWAASLRYHNGTFYAAFIAHEWDHTFLFTSENIEGPWTKKHIEGIYHDPSLLFDDDGKVYIAYGNRDIRLTELKEDLSGPKEGGLDRFIVRDAPGDFLGYEGSHIYKINGKYILTLIHSRPMKWFRTQACFTADTLDGVWAGDDVLESDLDGLNSGVAQGGLVDTPDGRWFSVMFQDHGAVGRVPVLVPITWNRHGYPVFGKVTKEVCNESTHPDHRYGPLYGNDDFTESGGWNSCYHVKPFWQFNHEPAKGYWAYGEGKYSIRTDKISRTIEFARNTLTQRTVMPRCAAEITIDVAEIQDGDVAGMCMLTGTYALIGITLRDGKNELVMKGRKAGEKEENEYARIPFDGHIVRFRAEVLFGERDEVRFLWKKDSVWEQLGPVHPMRFTLDHFCGCRFGLYLYATRKTGGVAVFRDFIYDTSGN